MGEALDGDSPTEGDAPSGDGEGHRPGHTPAVPDGYAPNKTCVVGRTVIMPTRRILAEVVGVAGTHDGVHQVTRVAALGPRGAKAAAEAALNLGVSLVPFNPFGGSVEASAGASLPAAGAEATAAEAAAQPPATA